MGKPSAPTPPNPVDTARASESTNVGSGVANAWLNNTNQVTPYGNLTYGQTGTYKWNDPYTGAQYDIPQFTATQTLSPQQQAILDQNQGAQLNLATLARTQSGRIGDLLSSNLDLSSAPAAGTAADLMPDSPNSLKVENALFGRLNPQLDRQRSQIEQRLADQGIRYGSQAYTSAMDDYNRQANDLRLGVTTQGAQEAQAIYNAKNTTRAQWLAEQYANRNQPINEITALMSGAQVSNPNFVNTPNYSIPTTDVGGLINTNFNQQQQNYQTGMSGWNSIMGGILGLGGSLGGASILGGSLGGGGGGYRIGGATPYTGGAGW
jgi:hypothetical protein